jgi:hypothetical protein
MDALLEQALMDSGETVTVVAAVLDGTLQVLAGEVARAVNAAVAVDGGGGSNRAVNNGSAIAADVTVIGVSGLVTSFGVVTAAVQGRVNNLSRGGAFGNLSLLNDGGSTENSTVTVIAAVLDGTLQVLAGEVARAVRAGKDLRAVKDRHFCFWNEPTTPDDE